MLGCNDLEEIALLAAFVEAVSLLGLTHQFVLEFLQLQIVHVEPTVNGPWIEQELVSWDGKQRPGEFPNSRLVEVLQVLRCENQREDSFFRTRFRQFRM